MKVTFWGVRGQVPAPGVKMNRYGGNTSCVEVVDGDDRIILDAGTGIIGLGQSLMKGEFARGRGRASLLISHLHWDHIQGFPFFQPLFVTGNEFTILGPGTSVEALEELLEGQMSPDFSPIQTMRNLGAKIDLVAVEAEASGSKTVSLGQFQIRAFSNRHGSTTALAYRIEKGKTALVYLSDVEYPASGPSKEVVEFCRAADLLIHDCTFSPEDKEKHRDRGLASIAEAVQVGQAAQIKQLAMFHYDQDYTDEFVDALAERTQNLMTKSGARQAVIAAREGLTIEL